MNFYKIKKSMKKNNQKKYKMNFNPKILIIINYQNPTKDMKNKTDSYQKNSNNIKIK